MHTIWRKLKKQRDIVLLITTFICLGLLTSTTVVGCAQKQPDVRPQPWAKERGIASSGKYRDVSLADLDNDGNLDIVGGGLSPGTAVVWYGEGVGVMSSPQFLPLKGDVRSVAIADFNEDGFKDIVLSVQKESSGIMIWMNQGNRKWLKGVSPIEINNYQGVETADVNKDGHMDVVAANSTSDTQGGIQIWLGDGKGAWLMESGPTITGVYMDVVLADFDKDGFLDLAGAGWGTYGALRVWLGDGFGGWSSTSPLSKGSYYGLKIGDVNGDDNLDILVGSYRQGAQIFLGDGNGNFNKRLTVDGDTQKQYENKQTENNKTTETSEAEEGSSFWQVIPVDLNEDGRIDILAGSVALKGITAWINRRSDNWVPITGRFPSVGTFYGMAVGDINQDGNDDILASSFGEGIKIWPARSGYLLTSDVRKKKTPTISKTQTAFEAPEENSVFTTRFGVPEYKIGPGDVVEITLWKGDVGTKEDIIVRPDGKISFSLITDLYVNGLTANELDNTITERIKEYIKAPQIDVLTKEHNSKFVTILGAGSARYGRGADKGKYPLTGKTTIVQMLSDYGGLHVDANLAEVSLRRKNGQTLTLDLFKAILRGETSQDVVLDDGDVIYIPIITKEANRVYVFGEVGSPGAYSFTGSEVRLMDAISQAGGTTVFAHEDSTKIVRGDPTRPEVISADLKLLLQEGDHTQNVALANGDLVYVPRSSLGDVNLFVKRIRPLLELILAPTRIIKDYDDAYDIISE